jgi:hypothetical protein
MVAISKRCSNGAAFDHAEVSKSRVKTEMAYLSRCTAGMLATPLQRWQTPIFVRIGCPCIFGFIRYPFDWKEFQR